MQFDDDNFPPLTSSRVIPIINPKKSFKDIFTNVDTKFNCALLNMRSNESYDAYYKRLKVIINSDNVCRTYNMYDVKHKNKTYRVIARHHIVALLLCQIDSEQKRNILSNRKFMRFRNNILEQMYYDEEMWNDVMSNVDGDAGRGEDAIIMYFNKTNPPTTIITNWITSTDVSCTELSEKCYSVEKILYCI